MGDNTNTPVHHYSPWYYVVQVFLRSVCKDMANLANIAKHFLLLTIQTCPRQQWSMILVFDCFCSSFFLVLFLHLSVVLNNLNSTPLWVFQSLLNLIWGKLWIPFQKERGLNLWASYHSNWLCETDEVTERFSLTNPEVLTISSHLLSLKRLSDTRLTQLMMKLNRFA